MNASPKRGQTVPAVAFVLALVAVVAAIAFGALRAPADPGSGAPSPSAPASPAPSTPASPAPATPAPATPAPSDEPEVPAPFDLDNPNGTDVQAVIQDETGRVVAGRSGSPVSGMSVRWFDLKVENVDADTLRLTYVALPIAEIHQVRVSEVDGQLKIAILMPLPYENSDALGQDLIIEIDFDEAVDAADIDGEIRSLFDD